MFNRLMSIPLGLLMAVSIQAEVLYVPDDFDTIQEAINEARNGDEIRVAEGEYVENIDFDGKAITLTGDPDDPATRIIDGDQNGMVVEFSSNEMRNSIINGFTLRNGRAEGHGGGGIYCNTSRPVISNLIIEDCTGNRGGGILCWGASPLISDVIVRNCTAAGYGGGICFSENSSPRLNNIELYDNRSENNGGGVASYSRGQPELTNVVIRDNEAGAHGGGAYIQNLTNFTHVTISGNSAGGHGGGFYGGGNVHFVNATIDNNSAEYSGGGLCFISGEPVFERVQITRNTAGALGGGMILAGADPRFNFITLSGNEAENGGGIYLSDRAEVILSNSIIRNESPQTIYFHDDNNSIVITFSDIEGGEDGIEANEGNVVWGAGNIDADPLFANPEEGDFGITWENFPEDDDTKSPCIDTADPDEDPDPDDSRADMGAVLYLQIQPEIAVDPEALDFGAVLLDQSGEESIVIGNQGNGVLNVSSISLIQEGDLFSIVQGGEAVDIEPDGEVEIRIRFAPVNVGEKSAQIAIESNDPENAELEVPLQGYGNLTPRITGTVRDITVEEDSDSTVLADLDTVFSDTEGEELRFVLNNVEAQHGLRINGTILYLIPAENYWMEEAREVELSGVDPFGERASLSFDLMITSVNDPPGSFLLLVPADGARLSDDRTLFDWTNSVDVDGDEIQYTVYLDFDMGELDTTLTWIVDTQSSYTYLWMNEIREYLRLAEDFSATWWVEASDDEFTVESFQRRTVVIVFNAVKDRWSGTPEQFRLFQNYPNPFNSTTETGFAVPHPAYVSLIVYDLTGRHIVTLAKGKFNTGYYFVGWDASGMESGVYLIKMESDDFRALQMAVLIR